MTLRTETYFPPVPAECDVLCAYRPCYQWGEDKGHYTAGIGYSSYHKNPIPACMTRLLRGCPIGAREEISAYMATNIKSDLMARSMAAITAKDTRELNKLTSKILARLLSYIEQKGGI